MLGILSTIKKGIGLTEDYDFFDSDLTMHINSVFTILHQLGVGPPEGFSIQLDDEDTPWENFLPAGNRLELVKSYMVLKVRLLFDPPASSAVIESINRQIDEFEWRLNVAVDPGENIENNNNKEKIQNDL